MNTEMVEIRDEDISSLLTKVEQHLTDKEKKIFVTLVEVAKTNAYLVKRLRLNLQMAEDALGEVYQISDNISLVEIADALRNPDLNSFSEQDVISSIENMKGELQSAANFRETLKTILSVAAKVAPILLL